MEGAHSSQQAAVLSSLDLPPPSAITDQASASGNKHALSRVNSELSKLELEDPSVLSALEKERRQQRQQDRVADTIASMELPEPEKLKAGASKQQQEQPNSMSKADLQPSEAPASVPTVALPAPTTTQTDAALLAEPGAKDQQIVTPWDVEGAFVDGKQVGIDYNKLIDQFGTKAIDQALLDRFEKLTGQRPHLLLRRGMFFSHRELDRILDRYEQKKPFFLYTGRGPSSDSMHVGHLTPFLFTA